jgi:outer membrane protein OmpA-like peptidoglycan-associated protein
MPSAWAGFQLPMVVSTPASFLPVVQAKLRINAPNDKYEQEADRVAEEVMRLPEAGSTQQLSARTGFGTCELLQCKCNACASGNALCPECEEEEKLRRKPRETQRGDDEEDFQSNKSTIYTPVVIENIAASIDSMRYGGQPLLASLKSFFQPRLGMDLSHVRVHTDTRTAEAARMMNARAFTVGGHIAFAKGEYAPEGTDGRQLLAHELIHVVQQTGHGQTPCRSTSINAAQVQRAPLVGCTDQQTSEVNAAIEQANTDLDAALPELATTPPSQKAQDAMWLTFRDTDELKTLVVRDILTNSKAEMPNTSIYCEQLADYGRTCKRGVDAYQRDGQGLNIHLCMDKWKLRSLHHRARTLIHESVHNLPIVGDLGYFGEQCEKSADTAALSMGELFVNADSYACLAYLLSHETEADLRSRVEYYQREYRGETLQGIVQAPAGPIDLDSDYEYLPRYYIRFEGEEGVPHGNKIPGAQYRWTLVDNTGTVYPIGMPGREGVFSDQVTALIPTSIRQQLKEKGAESEPFPWLLKGTIQAEIKIPGAKVDHFALQLPVVFQRPIPGWKDTFTIPFEIDSAEPNEEALRVLADDLISYGILMSGGRFHVDFKGHASRLGNDDYNLSLSLDRAQAVKESVELLLQKASEGIAFEFQDDEFKVTGEGEERARKALKPEDDDSPSDRVVDVVYEMK